MASGEQNVINWGGNAFVVNGAGELETVVDGEDRFEWLMQRANILVSYVAGTRAQTLSDRQASAMRDSLTQTLVDGGGVADHEAAGAWLDEVIASDCGATDLTDIVLGSDLFDGQECWKLFDDPVGEVEALASDLERQHGEVLVGTVASQLTLFE